MDPGRHHDFLANTDERSSRSTYYGREIPEITAHHYYGPATTTTQRPINTNSTRKPCGCVTTGSGTTAGSITCNGCRLNPSSEEGGWSTMTNTNQAAVEHMQRGVGVGGGMTAADYHHRMSTESSSLRSNIRQSPMYMQQHPPPPPPQSLQQQSSHGVRSMVPSQQQQHPSQHVVGTMPGQSRQSYWPQSSGAASTTQSYAPAGDEHMGGGLPPPPSQLQIDISVTRRTAPAPHDYGPYKTTSMSSSATHNNPHLSSSSSSGIGGYQLSTSSNSLHSRVSAIGGAAGPGPGPGPTNNPPHPYMTKDQQQRIYEHQKYSSTSSVTASKLPYSSTPASSAIYDSHHHHHHMNNQAMGKSLPPTIDHHVINPSNLPASKEQHPSPNYARKCPQMYAPEEQTTAHQHLYMSTPQFSSDKFTRASPQQPAPAPPPPPSSDFSKLRESPSGSAYMVAPHSGDKYATSHLQSSHLRESPQYATHASSLPRNSSSSSSSSSYYANSQTQNPSKILPPDMSPIIMKQSPHHHPQQHHYQYSKSPLPPPTQSQHPPPPPPSHMQTQQTTIPPPHDRVTTQHMAAKTGPPPPPPAPIPAPGHSQRYLMDSVKREDLEIYENPNQTPTRIPSGSSMYINPYNTPPPTGDNCCKEVALSTSSSPYNTGSATPNYRVESPQFYPTKYAKLAMNENLSSSKHSLINQNTPPPSRAPSQQRAQHQANYYYEGNSHSAPSPAAATAASPSPSALLTTTSQTPMHHPEYLGPTNMPSQHVYATQPTLAAQHQTPSSAALRHNDLMISVQTNSAPLPPPPTHHTTSLSSYERAIHHPNQPSSAAAAAVVAPPPPPTAVAKHVLTHPTSSTQPPVTGSNPAKPGAKHQKPNYRDLINQTLAIRNATSEEELNMQIIKKTLNVDTQNIRPPPTSSGISSRSMAPLPPQQPHLGVNERIPAPLREPSTKLKSMAPISSSVLVAPRESVAAANLPMPSSARVIEVPEVIAPRICIKQEDDKPSSSSGTTASSPLDLSMRTVKTKADSTEYKYQQRPTRLAGSTASSTTTPEGRYTLPRVDSTPIFSVHAFEPGAGSSNPVSSRSSSSRHNSLERRIYTPPNQTPLVTQGGGGGSASGSSSSLAGNVSPYNPTSTQHNIPNSSTQPTPTQYYGASNEAGGGGLTPRRGELTKHLPSQTLAGSYENSLVIKTAPKLNNISSDLVVRPSTITQPATAAPANLPQTTSVQPVNRPSVLETNPYASVIKTEPKRYSDSQAAGGRVSPRHTLAAVERLPPDTSIMALPPARNPYGVVRTAIQTNHNNNNNISSSNPSPSPQSNYSLACEKNPNFLGRKRHLQEYSQQQQMSLNEPEAKLKRYRDLSPQPAPLPSTTKPLIPMRPADISVIAVNEVVNMEERKSLLNHNKPRITEDVIGNTSVIASTNTNHNSKVIVNNVNHTSSPSVLMVCKQEPLTPTGEGPPQSHLNASNACVKTEMPANTFSSRIRTKAELKGFTFNPPPLPLPPAVEQTPPERNSTPPSPSPPPSQPTAPPSAQVTIKLEEQEEELAQEEESGVMHTNVKIKQEVKIDLPSIPGLDDEFEEKSLLDFGWNNTCNNFVEQLLTRPNPKKKVTHNLLNHNKTPLKDPDMVVSSTENMLKENHNLSNLESADNTTRSSFNRLETGVDSNYNLNALNQDSLNSQGSQGFNHKKLSKTEREKKRYHQEKRLAERLKAKDSSSESEDEFHKRKTERLKKPLMKAKQKAKTQKTGTNSSSSAGLTDKNRFSDCGSDSSGTEMEQQPKSLNLLKEIKQEKMDEEEEQEDKLKNNNEKCDIKTKQEKEDEEKEKEKEANNKKTKENKKINKQETTNKTKEDTNLNKIKQEIKSSTESSEQEQEEEEEEDEEDQEQQQQEEEEQKSKTKLNKQALNTMTRSKRKQELEQQLANSKVLRNDKIIRNFSNANSTNKIKRKYTRKYNTVNSLLESGGLSRESGIMKSTRLKAKLERNGGKLNLIKGNKNNLKNSSNKEAANNKLKSPKTDNVHDRNVIDLYRFKRALKVPPSLINIKHPGAHKAASLPDLERHAEALEAYAKKREKNCLNKQNKLKSAKSNKHIKSEMAGESKQQSEEQEEPKSIIDLLHSRVTKASGMNVRNKTTTTTAVYRPTKPCCTTSSNNNCGMFSETSQTTESSELQMLPELKKDSDLDEENDDNDSTNGKKRHFSIFDTKVLPTKTRTESKLQQKKENIREIFVGDDRPASAPPEMTQMLDSSEKMTYEQKYEQFLQQMNIVVSADTLGRLSKSAAAKRLGNTAATNGNQDLNSLNIKQEEGDTESTSVIDADDLKEDQKSLPNHFRKRRGRYLRRKGSSGFDYIRKKKKPSTAASQQQSHVNNQHNNGNNGGANGGGGSLSLSQTQFTIKSERYEIDEYEHKMKTEDDVSREIQKWVLNKGVGQSTMHKAARQGYIDVIVYCLDRMGMNPDQKDNAGYTPLHEACTNGWLNIARVLLQYGANHSEAAHSGIRPLHEASENDHVEIVRLLLSYGADPLLATYAGQTPLMLASSKSMSDILSNHLIDVQSMGPDRKPWRFNGPWEIYDPSECGYNVFEGAPNSVCDMSRALLRRGSLTNNQMYQNNKKLQNVLNTTTQITNANIANATTATTTNNITMSTTTTTGATATTNNLSLTSNTTTTTSTTTNSTTLASTSNSSAILNNSNNNAASSSNSSGNSTNTTTNNSSTNPSSSSSSLLSSGIENQQQPQQQQIKGENTTKTVMEKCAVVLDNIDRFNSVRLYNDNKPEILVENSDSDGEMFEFEEADVLLPPLYLLKDEGTQDKWVLLNDLCNLLKVKSKDTLLNKIYPSTTSSSSASAASAHKSHMRELKMSDFLEKATCLQLLCAGEKLNICASKVVLIKYNENVRNLLGVKTILMKF